MKKFFSYFLFHAEGIKMLKFIHKLDSSVIPVSLLSALIDAITPFVTFIISSYIIDNIYVSEFDKALYHIVILIAFIFTLGTISDILTNVFSSKIERMHKLIQVMIRKHALELDYEIIENPKILEMVTGAEFSMQHSGGFDKLLMYYREIFVGIIKIIFSITIVMKLCTSIGNLKGILGVITSIPVSVICMLVFVAINVIININLVKYVDNKNFELFSRHMKLERQFSYNLMNIIQNIPAGKTIRLYNMYDIVMYNCKKRVDGFVKGFAQELISIMKKQSVVKSFLSGSTVLFAYVFAVLKVIVGAISIGSLTMYIGAISELTSSSVSIFTNNDEIRIMCSFIKKFNDFLEIKNIKHTGSIPVEKRDDNEYEIEFHNVSFKYPGTEELILDNISCKLKLKKKMAIVGKNGAGKSTFIKLMCRLYDPTDGYITLNGIDIRKYNYNEYLTLFGVVFQDFNLFACPLGQNISTSIEFDETKVCETLDLVGIKERVDKMPLKLKTPLFKLDEGGVELSGGEAQKVAIARALYKNAPFVILDEPTAALDPISEYDIYKRFDELVYDKTSIYISHRMSSCRFCDNIMVFDKGKIVQWGSHDELVNDDEGLYSQLWYAQAKYYENEKTA